MIDNWLSKITTYRLILFYLLALLALGMFFGGLGLVPVNPLAVLETTVMLLGVTLATNWALAVLLRVTTNRESTVITALILALVLGPVGLESDPLRFGLLALGGVFAVASKYLLVWRRHHVFNPVALGIALTGLVFHEYASWWVGQEILLPAVVIGGLLLARKTNRLRFLGVFAGVFAAALFVWNLIQGLPWDQALQSFAFTFLQTEMPFFAFAMVTEPVTSPKRFVPQVLFLAVTAVLSLPQLSLFGFNFSPELALLAGNLVAFFLGPRGRHTLVLKEKRLIAQDTWAFAFAAPRGLAYRAGQYFEMTLPLDRSDSRGNRRYLSFASSPTEDEVLVAARFPEKASAFKQKWLALEAGESVQVAEVSGDFVLPRRRDTKLAFLTGGIGVTPVRSLTKSLVDSNESRDLVIIDSHSLEEHRVFGDVFDEARQILGAKVFPVVSRQSGSVDAGFLERNVPDVRHRTWYVSGSPGFVVHVEKALRSLRVPRWRIRTDFFPGY